MVCRQHHNTNLANSISTLQMDYRSHYLCCAIEVEMNIVYYALYRNTCWSFASTVDIGVMRNLEYLLACLYG